MVIIDSIKKSFCLLKTMHLTSGFRQNSRFLNMFCVCLLVIIHVTMASTKKRALCARGRYSTGVSAGQVPCAPCPRGRYGETSGLKTSQCTGACPQGKFSDKLGVATIADCQPCPPNTWSSLTGVTSNVCTPCRDRLFADNETPPAAAALNQRV